MRIMSRNGKQSPAEIAATINDVKASIAALEAAVADAGREVRSLLLPSHRDEGDSRERLKAARSRRTRNQYELDNKRELLPALQAELDAALAAEEAKERKHLLDALAANADAFEWSGQELDRCIHRAVELLRKQRDDLSSIRRRGGHVPSAEAVDVAQKDLVRTKLAPLYWLSIDQPSRRWTASELLRSWAGAIRGTDMKPVPAKRADAAPVKPTPDEELRVYDDVAELAKAHTSMMRGPENDHEDQQGREVCAGYLHAAREGVQRAHLLRRVQQGADRRRACRARHAGHARRAGRGVQEDRGE
jgi:hypothetical protein